VAWFVAVPPSIDIKEAGNNASSDPANNNSNNAETGFFRNNSSGWRTIKEVMKLYTVKDGVSDPYVCEVHAEVS
jgi:hypothetical protein